jgi:hypothetical protein
LRSAAAKISAPAPEIAKPPASVRSTPPRAATSADRGGDVDAVEQQAQQERRAQEIVRAQRREREAGGQDLVGAEAAYVQPRVG